MNTCGCSLEFNPKVKPSSAALLDVIIPPNAAWPWASPITVAKKESVESPSLESVSKYIGLLPSAAASNLMPSSNDPFSANFGWILPVSWTALFATAWSYQVWTVAPCLIISNLRFVNDMLVVPLVTSVCRNTIDLIKLVPFPVTSIEKSPLSPWLNLNLLPWIVPTPVRDIEPNDRDWETVLI